MLVRLCDVSVSYGVRSAREVRALQGLDFTMRRGEIVGILGRSGSGKSTLGALLAGSLPGSACLSGGTIEWNGGEAGGRAAIVPQSPSAVLSPFLRCGEQVKDVLLAQGHAKVSVGERARALFQQAGLPAERRAERAWPHELSGGELQRVAVARALAMGRSILVADESTSALDPIHATSLLACMKRTREESGLAILWITHDPSELFQFADRVLTMDEGCVAEEASGAEFAVGRTGPLTRALVESMGAGFAGAARPRG